MNVTGQRVVFAVGAMLLLGASAAAQTTQWAYRGTTGRLIYVPDAEGDRILDFAVCTADTEEHFVVVELGGSGEVGGDEERVAVAIG